VGELCSYAEFVRRAAATRRLTRAASYPHSPGVSNALRYDSLLLRALAGELDAQLRGMRVARAQFERTTRVLVLTAGTRQHPLTLNWNLHPAAGHVVVLAGTPQPAGAQLQVRPGTSIARVSALPDERVARIDLDLQEAAPGGVRALLLELIGSRWNAFALGENDVIAAALVIRPNDPRGLRPGLQYRPPAVHLRLGAHGPPGLERWSSALASEPAAERTRLLLATFAYTSPLNASWILGDAAVRDAAHLLEEAYHRYRRLVEAPPQACLLDGWQPYPQPLAGTESRAASLLEAFALAATGSGSAVTTGQLELREQALAVVHERERRLRTRLERLEQEAAGAGAEAAELRARADLVLANLHEIPRGAAEVVLTDFEGRERLLRLDPGRAPQQTAQEWYQQARRRERAAERVPALQQRAAAELRRLDTFRQQLLAGQAAGRELEDWLRRSGPAAARSALPYRKYRSSGGLELRVGRNARANDALTRDHASPEDIWLHARDAGGAHVVLRWGRRVENPPRADLVEAAILAALHSQARTSGVVPVDWTRRKYVRKPRKAAPGQVVLERARTIFVTPDRDLEQRLRVEESE